MRKAGIRGMLALTICSALVVAGCGSNNSNGAGSSPSGSSGDSPKQEVVKFTVPHYQVGNAIGADYLKSVVELYNEKFKGKYELTIEEVAGDSQYIEKLKVLSTSNQLPAFFELGKDLSLGQQIIKNDQVLDLKPYIDAEPELKALMFEDSIEFNTVDGKMVGLPLSRDAYLGVFYNKELFEKAGIPSFPETWDEFWEACEKLKAAGITPLSLTTAESEQTNYFVTSKLAVDSAEGLEFMRTTFPTDFDAPYVVDAFAITPKLFSYSTPDAIGGTYAMAANNFTNGVTAMIGNGPWMVDTFKNPSTAPEGFLDKVGVAYYPGKALFSNQGKVYGWAVANNQPKEVQEAAIEFLKFISTPEIIRKDMVTFGRFSPKVELTDEDKAQLDPQIVELAELVQEVETVIPRIRWDTSVLKEAIPKELPRLALDRISAEEYGQKLAESARKFAQVSGQ
ncbi:ABC transporter substrate-binding protein [Paenibacillaceae bacterium WGS1546]|uniref:ABC transporter substrate-binding protein n=1 Tax=Cohnella sp. WGS1546 TaxID=3366810 RepID=UPI00372D66F4